MQRNIYNLKISKLSFTKLAIILITIVLISVNSYAVTKTASVSGNWNSNSTWGGKSVPTTTDDVIINAGISVTIVNSSAVCKSLKLNNNSFGTASLSFNNNNGKLVISGIITLSGNEAGKNGTLDMTNGGTIECNEFNLGNGTANFISGIGTVLLNTTNTVLISTFHNLILNNGTSTLSSNTSISGNIIATNGILHANGKDITLNGNSLQTITGSISTNNLIINNTCTNDAIQLNSPITILGNLTCIDGIINAISNPIIFGPTANVLNAKDASHVKGIIKKQTSSTSSFIFPTGNGQFYRPIGIINPSNDTWTASYTNTEFGNYKVIKSSDLPIINHVSRVEYWDLTPTNIGTSSSKIQLSWNDLSDVLDPATTLLAHWNSANNYWENVGDITTNVNDKTITSNNSWNTFSPFTLASSTEDGSLPIELLYIESKCGQNDLVNVTWATASEENNDYFSVLRSNDGITWKNIAKIPGSGTSKNVKNYNFVDQKPTEHDTYYKIGQTDYDGKNEEFDIMSIYCLYNHKHITLSPIPAQDFIMFDFYNEHHIVDNLSIRIFNQYGQLVHTQYFQSEPDNNSHKINLPENLNNGTYFLQVKLGETPFYSCSFIRKL